MKFRQSGVNDNLFLACDTQPYEVTEFGWGEFELSIKIYFVDASERPVELFHHMKLYPLDGSTQVKKKPVVAEHYDEIVFHEPTESFYSKLKHYEVPPGSGIKISPHPAVNFTSISLNEAPEAEKILAAKAKVKHEILKVKAEYDEAEAEIQRIKGFLGEKGYLVKL